MPSLSITTSALDAAAAAVYARTTGDNAATEFTTLNDSDTIPVTRAGAPGFISEDNFAAHIAAQANLQEVISDWLGGTVFQAGAGLDVDFSDIGNTITYSLGANPTVTTINVTGGITVGGTVDGVDIATFKNAYDTHASNTSNPHSVTPTQLSLVIGTDVQAYNATLASLSALGTAADRFPYTTAANTWAEGAITAFGRSILDDADAATVRTTIGVDAAGTDNSTDVTLAAVAGNYLSILGQEITAGVVPVSLGGTGATTAAAARTALGVDPAGTDNSTNVTLAGTLDYLTIAGQVITRNAIVLTTDVSGILPIANGGTAASTASGARTSLGLAIGTNVQAYSANLDTYASIAPSANVQTLLGSANYAAFNESLGLGLTDSPEFAGLTAGDVAYAGGSVNLDASDSSTWVVVIAGFGGDCSAFVSARMAGGVATVMIAYDGTTGLSSDISISDGIEMEFRINGEDLEVRAVSSGSESASVTVSALKMS